MADPMTMMIAAAAFKSAGKLVSGYSEAAGYEAQANAEGYNARLATQNAETASSQANLREEQMRREARQVQGEQRAAIAEGGTGFGGSNLDIVRQDASLAELDALNARYTGALQRTSYTNEAASHRFAQKSLKKAAGRAKINAWISTGAEMIGGTAGYGGGGSGGGGGNASAHISQGL